MFSSDLYSHPEIKLHDHLTNVADNCLNKFIEDQSNLSTYFGQRHWENIVWLMGFLHDFGKSTVFFQKYLFEKNPEKKASLKNSRLTNHSLFSAIVAHHAVSMYVGKSMSDTGLLEFMPLFIFLVIKKHHGNLNNAVRIKGCNDENELETAYEHVDEQIQNCSPHEISSLFTIVNARLSMDISVDNFPVPVTNYYKESILRAERSHFNKIEKHTEFYFIFQYLYSLLLHSDKEDAIFGGKIKYERKKIKNDAVKRFISNRFGTPKDKMDQLRHNIFNDAEKTISNADIAHHKLFSLNVPTGTGKTYTSLAAALKLKARLEEKNISPRIIYSLPFTSIIDQNYEVINEVLSDPGSDVLIKHHHLADISYKSQQEEFEPDHAKFLIESWDSEIIVTTTFQIFHTLFSNRNRMAQKFRKFANAIVLLDEIQTLPYKYWLIAKKAMECLSKIFNTCFILITATQPRIFEESDLVELVPEKHAYFSKLDRVKMTFNKDPLTLGDYMALAKNKVKSDNQSYLFVMNTVNSALKLFQALNGKGKGDFYFLSTNIIPVHRMERIREIRQSKCRKIIVSTQMIEAGVDISIDNVWRDFGPLESINQVCGRCNRNGFSGQKGSVHIFQLLDEANKNTPFAKYIYGKNALTMVETKSIIEEQKQISESDFLKNMDRYYQQIKLKQRSDTSELIQAHLDNLQFLSLYKAFRLIDEENYERKDVFVEIDDEAQRIWEIFAGLGDIKDRFQRKNEFLKIKKDFHNYVISVPAKFVPETEYEQTGYVYINREMVPTCYDLTTGWKRAADTTYNF